MCRCVFRLARCRGGVLPMLTSVSECIVAPAECCWGVATAAASPTSPAPCPPLVLTWGTVAAASATVSQVTTPMMRCVTLVWCLS
jgi:hypothetical protein